MQIVSLTSAGKTFQRLDSKTPLRLRALRLLSEKYTYRERPSVAAEFVLFAVIAIVSAWPLWTLAHVMALIR
jgi:hypothetical protein